MVFVSSFGFLFPFCVATHSLIAVIQFYSILFICCILNNATSGELFEASSLTMISESFFLYLSLDLCLPTHPGCRWLSLHLIIFSITHTYSVGLPWVRDWSVTETSTCHHTTFIRDRHPCPRRNSNPQSQQANGSRHTP